MCLERKITKLVNLVKRFTIHKLIVYKENFVNNVYSNFRENLELLQETD